MHAMDSEVDTCPLTCLHDLVLKLLLYLCDYFLDTCRVDTAVDHELVESKSCNLPSYRVECRKENCLRSVVYNDFHSCSCLESADVTSFTSDDAALDLVAFDMEYSHGVFDSCFRSCSLDCVDHDTFSFLACGKTCLVHDIVDV